MGKWKHYGSGKEIVLLPKIVFSGQANIPIKGRLLSENKDFFNVAHGSTTILYGKDVWIKKR